MSPEATDLFEQLERFALSMREFLGVLECSTPDDDRVSTSWERCSEAFRELGHTQGLLEQLEPEDREEAEGRIDELVRLNAVLTAAVRRERDHLVQQLDRTSSARRAFSRYGRTGGTGGTCDLSG